MTLHDLIDLRGRLNGCELIAYVDVVTGTPLIQASAFDVAQDDLNLLARRAVVLLNGMQSATEKFAIAAQPVGTEVFVRKDQRSAEALCLLFSPDASLDGVADTVMATLPDPVSSQVR